MMKTTLTAFGAVGTAFASTLCCAGPLIAVTAGVSSAGLASAFEPLRPFLLGATAISLGVGFVLMDREEKAACAPGKACADPIARKRMKIILWTATVVSVIFASYPSWQDLVL